ncbi:MAG: dTDP-4-dehydrorhamnose reductase [archaeon]|jgi:dTDP-4-dehydrorhamnose reductase
MKKILITGISGQIGSSLLRQIDELFSSEDEIFLLKHHTQIFLPSNTLLDFRIIDIIDGYYDLAIHLAANSDIAYCQDLHNKNSVWKQNVTFTQEVCNAARQVILVSTDYVFNGNLQPGQTFTEYGKKNPLNVYGQTKAEAEDIVLSCGGIVLRVETMMGAKNKIIDAAKKAIEGTDPDYRPFWTNNFIRPSYFPDFLKVLKKVIHTKGPAIYHVSCEGDALSRSEMAAIVLDVYKEKGWKRVLDSLRSEEAAETKRFVLDTQKTKKELDVEFTDSRKAVRNHVLKQI